MESVTAQSCLFRSADLFNQADTWVTVICTCYNQADFVEQALLSVVEQTYPCVELIVIDNASSDQSVVRIAHFAEKHPAIRCLYNPENIGLNRAFNQGLAMARGKYVIDLSADDVLLPDRIEKQVAAFDQLPSSCAVVFSNAAYINALGQQTGLHYHVDAHGRATSTVPTGDVFCSVLRSYFICTPTMMMRRTALDALGGYDETLAFEDFDFWVRSARAYTYAYVDEVLTLKRILDNSLATRIRLPNNPLLKSTLMVCHKAYKLCRTPDEFRALAYRIRTFIRKAFYAEQFEIAHQFGDLLNQLGYLDGLSRLYLLLSYWHVPVNKQYQQYLRWRSKR